MAKSFEDRWWEWLRVGRRIELVSFLYSILAFSIFAMPSTLHFWKGIDQPGGTIILVLFIAGALAFALAMGVPLYFLLRRRRKKWKAMVSEVEHGVLTGPRVRPSSLSRA